MMARVDKRAAALAVVALMLLGPACGESAEPPPEPTYAPAPTATSAPTPTATPTPQARSQGVAFRWEGVPTGTDAAPPAQAPALPGGAIGFSHYVFEQVGGNIVTTLVEGPRHLQVRVPASYRQLKEWADAGSVPVELNMSLDELSRLVAQLDTVRTATEKFRDVDVALKAGYRQATEEVPNMGAHFVHPLRSLDGKFDPARPEILLYVRDEEGEWELVGTSFVQSLLLAGFDHPQAFVGPLDNWHVHYELCTGPTFTSRSATQAECRKDGGVWVPAYGWMIHAWVWVDNPLGVFTMWNPEHPACRRAGPHSRRRQRRRRYDGEYRELRVRERHDQRGRYTGVVERRRRGPHRDRRLRRPIRRRLRLRARGPGRLVPGHLRRAGQLRLHLHPALLHVRRRSGDTVGDGINLVQGYRALKRMVRCMTARLDMFR